jgi:hypothetical protein
MKMRLITYLLVLCLTFSIGSALAQTNMEKTNATNMQMTAGTIPQKTILVFGNVTGNYNILGEEEKDVTGFVAITKDLNNSTERVQLWDSDTRNVITAYGPLTPVNVKQPTNLRMALSQVQPSTLGLAAVKDFNCNMTNMKQDNGQEVNFKLTGSEMSVFGGYSDVNNFLKPNSNASECSLTKITTFPVPLPLQPRQ